MLLRLDPDSTGSRISAARWVEGMPDTGIRWPPRKPSHGGPRIGFPIRIGKHVWPFASGRAAGTLFTKTLKPRERDPSVPPAHLKPRVFTVRLLLFCMCDVRPPLSGLWVQSGDGDARWGCERPLLGTVGSPSTVATSKAIFKAASPSLRQGEVGQSRPHSGHEPRRLWWHFYHVG